MKYGEAVVEWMLLRNLEMELGKVLEDRGKVTVVPFCKGKGCKDDSSSY